MNETDDRFQQAMDQGHTAAWDLDWTLAVSSYQQALELKPDNPKALANLGLAFYELGRLDEAFMIYTQIVEISPDDPIPHEKLGQIAEETGNNSQVPRFALRAADCYLKDGNVEKVIENLVRVTRVDPENLQALSRLAFIYEKQGRLKQSVSEYLAVASILQSTGDTTSAYEAIQHALTLLPESEEGREALVTIEQGRSLPKPVKGSSLTRNKLIILPESPAGEMIHHPASGLDPISEARQKALSSLIDLIFEGSDENLSKKPVAQPGGFQAILRGVQPSATGKAGEQTDPLIYLRQAVSFQSEGKETEAAEELEKAVQYGLDHPAAYFFLGYMALQHKDHEKVGQDLQKAVQDADLVLASRLLQGDSFYETGSFEEAATQYMLALWSAEAQVVSSDLSVQLRSLYPSWIEAETKLTDQPGRKDLCTTIRGLLERNDWQAKIIQTREELKVDNKQGLSVCLGEVFSQPNGALIVRAIMNINQYARAGYLRTAMEEAYFSLQSAPIYLPLHMYMGELLLKEDRVPDAIAKFSTVAHTYQARGETDQAARILRRVKKIAPMDQQSRQKLIVLLKEQGETNAAIDEYIQLAEVYYSLAELSQARQTYQDAYLLTHQTDSNPELEIQLLYKIADIDMQSLDWRSALDIYAQIRTINPDDELGRQKIIGLCLRLGNPAEAESEIDEFINYLNFTGDQEKALEFLKKLAHENPDQIFIWYRLADYYQKLGRNTDAINELDRLGEILIDAGDPAAAAQVIERIVALEPDNIDRYKAILAQLEQQNKSY